MCECIWPRAHHDAQTITHPTTPFPTVCAQGWSLTKKNAYTFLRQLTEEELHWGKNKGGQGHGGEDAQKAEPYSSQWEVVWEGGLRVRASADIKSTQVWRCVFLSCG